MTNITELLQRYWGYTSFLPYQKEIITSVLNGHDTLAVMATGGGKSLCYQLPALVLGGLTIVISPLIALMKNQVDDLNERGIRAVAYNSTLDYRERVEVERGLQNNTVRMLFISPEKCMQPSFLSFINRFPVRLIAIDEAHCISEWGHNFRPEYRQLSALREHFPPVPIVALTATAIPAVREDICTQLQLSDVREYIGSFNRPNLSYRVVPKNKPVEFILDYIGQHPNDSGIVYCLSRKATEDLAETLVEHGHMASAYHAGLLPEVRKKVQEAFIKDDISIICATVAFGMGIDKPDVRYVIHHDLPKSVEAYYQESGRAGRDGQPGECILLYSRGDLAKVRYLLEHDDQDEEQSGIAFKKMQEVVDYCETNSCRRKYLLAYFGEEYPGETCDACDNCTHPQELFDGTGVAEKIVRCVRQLPTKYGAGMITDILLGSKKAEIGRLRFDALPAYATGKGYDRNTYLTWIGDLVRQGYLSRIGDKYPVIALTAKSEEILRGGVPVMLPLPQKTRQRRSEVPGPDAMTPEEGELFLALKKVRKDLADRENVPPYIIFSDRTLMQMARLRPCDQESILAIGGVGEYKSKKFGPAFIAEIKRVVQEDRGMTPSGEGQNECEGHLLEGIFLIDREIKRLNEEIDELKKEKSALLDQAMQSGIEEEGRYSLRCSLSKVRELNLEAFKNRYPEIFMEVGIVRLKDVDEILGKDVVTELCTITESKTFKVAEREV